MTQTAVKAKAVYVPALNRSRVRIQKPEIQAPVSEVIPPTAKGTFPSGLKVVLAVSYLFSFLALSLVYLVSTH